MTQDTKAVGLCGVLNIDKPPGLTSHDVVVAVRRMARQRKVGHAGTLDPMATGVLLVCLGQATRVSQYLMHFPKVYRAAVMLGVSTTTHDAEGEVTAELEVDVTRDQVDIALRQFIGRVRQVPPMYSAIKHKGRRLYELARQGIEVEVPAREVEIHSLRVVEWASPALHLEVRCGPGTYIRALARDLGEALGCGAHLTALRRLSSGSFTAADAVTLQQLDEASARGELVRYLQPLDVAFLHLPALLLDSMTARRLAMGQSVAGVVVTSQTGSAARDDEPELARAYAPGEQFVALVYRDQQSGVWRPRKVFVEPQQIELSQMADV